MNDETTAPLLGGAFVHQARCLIFHGYDMSTPVRPRISWMDARVSYAPDWNNDWGSIDRAVILPVTNGFVPRNSTCKSA